MEHLLDDPRFESAKARFDNMETLIALLDGRLSTRSRDEWGALFDEHRIVWGPVLGLHEVASDGQAEAVGLFPTIDDPQLGAYRTVGIPMHIRDSPIGPRGRAPELGEHTRAVLRDVGYSPVEITTLCAAGAVADGAG